MSSSRGVIELRKYSDVETGSNGSIKKYESGKKPSSERETDDDDDDDGNDDDVARKMQEV